MSPWEQWPKTRNVVLFMGGIAGVLHETIITSGERPSLLVLFAAMMGLPAFLQGKDDEPKRGDKK